MRVIRRNICRSDLETFGKPDAWKLARPVWGWGRAVMPGLHHTTRGNQGWRATAPTLRECNVDFEMQWKPGDAAFSAVKTAFLTAGTVEMEVLDQLDGEGPHGNFSITNFSRSEPLEEALGVSVTAKLAEFIEWLEGTGTAT